MLKHALGARTLTRVIGERLALAGLLGCLALAGCAASSGGTTGGTTGGGTNTTTAPTATATLAPTPQATTCTKVQGFSGATSLSLPNMELPAGAIAPAPTTSFGGAGQYTVKTYTVCVPNNTGELIVSTGKGPEPLTHLLSFYGWAEWNHFPAGGDAQQSCAQACFAFNMDDLSKALFTGAPRFLSVEQITPLPHNLVTFTLKLAQASAPTCPSMFDTSDTATYGHAPEYTLYYDLATGIQWPPMTRLVGNSAPDIIGQDLCSAGTTASVKAFMDHQFSSNGYTSVACTGFGNDCWKSGSTTVMMNITSASDWTLGTPRPQP